MGTTNNNRRRQQTINRSFVDEAEGDARDALAAIQKAQREDDVFALRQAQKALRMAERRVKEAHDRAVPPEGQATLEEVRER